VLRKDKVPQCQLQASSTRLNIAVKYLGNGATIATSIHATHISLICQLNYHNVTRRLSLNSAKFTKMNKMSTTTIQETPKNI